MMLAETYDEVKGTESEAEEVTPNVTSPTRRLHKKNDKTILTMEEQPKQAPSTLENITLGGRNRWRPGYQKLYETLYLTNTREGQRCNLLLMILTAISVTVAVVDSVDEIRVAFNNGLIIVEVLFTLIFTVEYALRLICLQRPRDYAISVYGIVDMVSILPTYFAFLSEGARPLMHLLVLRVFRILRVFRVLKLVRFIEAAATLMDNIHQNKRRITVFLFAVFAMILVIGCAMYLIEGERHGFSNIPKSMYWTVVTLTTVGYGDITPKTVPGQLLATIVMFVGYGLIACPMVLTTAKQMSPSSFEEMGYRVMRCPTKDCHPFMNLHQEDAKFCRKCGSRLSINV